MAVEDGIARPGGVSYLRIPAPDARRVAAFYREVFGWTVDTERALPSFRDGTGHVIGHFVSDQEVAGAAGIRPYVFVESVAAVVAAAAANGGSVETAPYTEGELVVATLRDPAGNVVGAWQLAGRPG